MTKLESKRNHTVPAYPSQIGEWTLAAAQVSRSKSWWARQSLNAAVSGALKVEFTERQYERGRQSPDETLAWFQFRATLAEIESWRAEAESEGLELAEWERQVLEAARQAKDLRFLLGAA